MSTEVVMSSSVPPQPLPRVAEAPPLPIDREVGRIPLPGAAVHEGPTLIAVGAIHGNEQAGIHAARRVLTRLSVGDVDVRGELVVLAGNVGAIREGRRYRARDLNRMWTAAQIDAARVRESTPGALDPEEHELLGLFYEIRKIIRRARGPVFVLDLHTTSASGVPFALFGDTLEQRAFATCFPLPIIMGLEEQLDGVLSGYWTRQGCTTLAVEGGQHDEPETIDNLEAVLLVAVEAAGLVRRDALREVRAARRLLAERRGDLPPVLEVISRHAITAEDAFVMEPGFRNLDFARAAQLLARHKGGEIRAPRDGMVILPLYQGQGDDGFFWGRAVSDARLRASRMFRHLKLDRLLPLLPGVERDPSGPGRFSVDLETARYYPLDVFHMLGYRRIRKTASSMTVEAPRK